MATANQLPAPLELKWIFGFNKNVSRGVHDLTGNQRWAVFYPAGHTGIIYDYRYQTQRLLQGHCNQISCACVSDDKRWIVTGDIGEDGIIVVWDSFKGIPIRTIDCPYEEGIYAIDFSPNGQYVAYLTAGEEQELVVWDWTDSESEGIGCAIPVSKQERVRFGPAKSTEIVTTGNDQVLFWQWTASSLEPYIPTILPRDNPGSFTESIILPMDTLAASVTTTGNIVLWDMIPSSYERSILKVVKVFNCPIRSLEAAGGQYIVAGGDNGVVRFMDSHARLIAWFEDLNGGPISSISFSLGPAPADASELAVTDFIVATKNALVIQVEAGAFERYDTEALSGKVIVHGHPGGVWCIDSHPSEEKLVAGCSSGNIQLWNYESGTPVVVAILRGQQISSIKYDPTGEFIVAGCASGTLKILESQTLQQVDTFRPGKSYISDIEFSSDGTHMAIADLDSCVALFRNMDRQGFEYVGRHRCHKGAIVGIEFRQDHDRIRLISIGEDKMIVEHDVKNSTVERGLKATGVIPFEQTATPTAFLWTSADVVPYQIPDKLSAKDKILTTNNKYKCKTFIVPDSLEEKESDESEDEDEESEEQEEQEEDKEDQLQCISTVVGPTFAGPPRKFIGMWNKGLLAYSTAFKVIGLIKLPISGNPANTMGVIAHSGEVSSITSSHDGNFLISAGADEYTVCVWEVFGEGFDEEASEQDRNREIKWVIDMLDENERDQFIGEAKNYFFYAQLRARNSAKPDEGDQDDDDDDDDDSDEETDILRHKVGHLAPISEVGGMMRACGVYLSNMDMENLYTELHTLNALSDNPELIDFDTFLKLYINHRPVIETSKEDIQEAFRKLGAVNGVLSKDLLFDRLLNEGEIMNRNEINWCLSALLGEDITAEQLEDRFTAEEFAGDLLGFTEGLNEDEKEEEESNEEKKENQN